MQGGNMCESWGVVLFQPRGGAWGFQCLCSSGTGQTPRTSHRVGAGGGGGAHCWAVVTCRWQDLGQGFSVFCV